MKTLADLKRDCEKYKWFLVSNSWFPENKPDWHNANHRKVVIKQSKSIAFETLKGASWVNFPKAKNLIISPAGEDRFFVVFMGDNPEDCTLEYHLIPNEEC